MPAHPVAPRRLSADPPGLTATEMARQETILADELAAGRLVPPDGEPWCFAADPDCAAPPWWDGELPDAEPEPRSGSGADASRSCGAQARCGAGVAEEGPSAANVVGFAQGGLLDELEPGPALAGLAEQAIDGELSRLDDDQLVGVLAAARRVGSWSAALEVIAVGELSRRREATGRLRELRYLDDEIAAALTLSTRAASDLTAFACGITRLPGTLAALRAGLIDRLRAMIITEELSWLDPARAAAVEQLILPLAPGLTAGRLRNRVRQAVLAADPDSAQRRRQERQRDARVELWNEQDGTTGLVGRDLPTAAALIADARVDAQARALKAAGADATLAQLRAAVFLASLAGRDVHVMLAAILDTPADATPGAPDATGGPDADGAQVPARDQDSARSKESARGQSSARGKESARGQSSARGKDSARGQSSARDRDSGRDQGLAGDPAAGASDDGLAIRGSVHLTVPLTTWLELTDSPGDISGYGPADAGTSRDLAEHIRSASASRWCLTITDPAGRAIAHACARRPPPGSPAGRVGWLGKMKITRIETGTCSHAREVPGYRIPNSLHHIVKTRQRTCSAPGCSRPARRCDDDHTLPYDQGGRTCDCNLSPLCRRHHQAKQAQGWYLEQPEPGVLVWRMPHRRRYVVTPGEYPI